MKAFCSPLPARSLRLGRALRRKDGGTLVETALSLGLLFALLFGVLEVCLMLYTYHYISYAARAGTRYAIVHGGTWSTGCDVSGTYSSYGCTASPTDIANYVAGLGFPGIGVTAPDVCVAYSSTAPTSSACAAGSTPNKAGDWVQVQVTYQFPFTVPFLPKMTFGSCTPVGSVCMASTSSMVISE